MNRLSLFSIRNPKAVTAMAILITVAAAPGMLWLRLRADGQALVPQEAAAVEVDRGVRYRFGVHDLVVLYIRANHPDGIFNPHTLSLIEQLTEELKTLPDIVPEDVTSLATERGHRVHPGTIQFRRFLEPPPVTPEDLQRLRDDLRAIRLYSGTLVSRDEHSAAVLAGVLSGCDRPALIAAILELVAAKGPISEEIHVIGAPAAESLLGTHILEDLGVPASMLGHHRQSAIGNWKSTVGLVPISLAVMFMVFLACFRSPIAALLPLAEVGACLIFVFGLMGWTGVPVYLTIAVLPVILTVVGVADEIHLFKRYSARLRDQIDESHLEALTVTVQEMTLPVVKASVTTAIGFLSFAASPMPPVRAFGVFTAVGVLFCMIWSLTVIPATLAVISPARFTPRGPETPRREAEAQSAIYARWARAVVRHPVLTLILCTALVTLSPLGLKHIVVQDSWIDGFAGESAFRKAMDRFNDEFLGMHVLLLALESSPDRIDGELPGDSIDHHHIRLPSDAVAADPRSLPGRRIKIVRTTGGTEEPPHRRQTLQPRPSAPAPPGLLDTWHSWITEAQPEGDAIVLRFPKNHGSPKLSMQVRPTETFEFEIQSAPMLSPEVINKIGAFEQFVDAQREETVGGVLGPAVLLRTTNLISRGLNEEYRTIPDTTDRVEWLWQQYGRVRGESRLRQVVDERYTRGLITVFLKNANFVDVGRLLKKIRDYEEAQLRPLGMRVEFAGDVAVSQTLIDAIVATQVRSVLGSLVGALLVMALLSKSILWGVLALIPCCLAVLMNFAVMGWAGIPLGVATSMFAAMTLGIADDYAIHLLERYRLLVSRGRDKLAAIVDALRQTGPAVFVDALGVGLGFGILSLSQVPANARLGGLVILNLVMCFVATLTILPALASILPPPRAKPPGVALRLTFR